MARSPLGTPGPRARRGFAVLSLGMVLMLTGPAWSSSREEPQKLQVDGKSQVDMIEVEPGSLTDPRQTVALVPSGAFLNEIEPNDTTAAAQVLATTPVRVRGNLFRAPFVAGNTDVDIYSFTAAAGDRVYAATMTSFSRRQREIPSSTSSIPTARPSSRPTTRTGPRRQRLQHRRHGAHRRRHVLRARAAVRHRLPRSRARFAPTTSTCVVQSGAPTAEVEPNNNGQPPNPLPANGWMSGALDARGRQRHLLG